MEWVTPPKLPSLFLPNAPNLPIPILEVPAADVPSYRPLVVPPNTLRPPPGIEGINSDPAPKAEDFSDGEQNVLPVLSNRMLVTETLPMWVRSNQSKTFTFLNIFGLKSNKKPKYCFCFFIAA